MTTLPTADLILYGRPGCGLCDEARATLGALLAERAARGLPCPTVVERDISADPALERAFFTIIPVVEYAGRRLELVTSLAGLRRFLVDSLDSLDAPDLAATEPA